MRYASRLPVYARSDFSSTVVTETRATDLISLEKGAARIGGRVAVMPLAKAAQSEQARQRAAHDRYRADTGAV
jgi:hypothetical protein